MAVTNKDIVVNIQEVANVWMNIAMGCKALFYLSVSIQIILCIIWVIKNWKSYIVPIDWWNAEYKEPISKEHQAESDKFDVAFQDGYNNGYAQARFDYEQEPTAKDDSAVDCISREQAIDAFPDLLPNIGYNKKAITETLQELPSVTPTRPKGHWVDGHCSKCGCDIPSYIVDWKWQKDMDAKFCPNCGSDNREVKNDIH